MIKLKNILSEAYAWEREPGQPLPNMKTVQEKYQKNLKEQDPQSTDPVLGNPGKQVNVNPANPEVYDINGNLLPDVPADLNKNLRVQNYREVTVTPKYYFQTKNMGETNYVRYDVKTGQLIDNNTGEKLVKLSPGLPARQVYLWLRRNHMGKADTRFKRESVRLKESFEDELDAADEANEGAKPDYVDLDKDGNEEESMKQAAKDAEESDKEVNEEETEEESDHAADTASVDMDVLNMGSLEEGFWNRVKGNLHGHEYILREAFRK